MKGRAVILDRLSGGRAAAALMVDGRLEDIFIDDAHAALPPGTICRGVIGRVLPGPGAAFVTLAGGETGFLRRAWGMVAGAPVTVEVRGPRAEDGKALPVSVRLALKGRFVILTPEAPGINLSRRIGDRARREALATLGHRLMNDAPAGMGLVLRSAAGAADDGAIAADFATTMTAARRVLAPANDAPAILLPAPGAHDMARREWFDPPPDTLADHVGAFADHGVDEAIAEALAPALRLGNDADMWVEPTRALVAVDVNTGGDTTPAAALKANIGAARALPRALRLRGLGGQVAIDFAPMAKRLRPTLEREIRAAFADEAHVTLAGWSPLGLYELARARDRAPLSRLWP